MIVSQGEAENLLQILADPAKAKERLDALVEQAKAVHEAAAKAAADRAAAEATQKETILVAKAHADDAAASLNAASLTLTVHRQEVAKFEVAVSSRKEALDAREAALNERERQLVIADGNRKALDLQLAKKQDALMAQEANLVAKHADASKTLEHAQNLRTHYEKKVQALQSAMTDIVPGAGDSKFGG